jgi:shikimate kinase / 3-dehydroquinate synthase
MTSNAPNIILCGFMATGKTTVGQEVASRLGRPFIDMDDVLVQRLGAPIADVFTRHGEARFRRAENALCQELSTPRGAVIAAGGGAIVSVENRLALSRGGLLICLTCSPQECLCRIGDPTSRPMLNGGEPAARLVQVMAEREPIYAAVPRQVDTTHLSVAQAAERIVALYERDARIQIQPVRHDSGAYDIAYGDGVLAQIGEIVRQRGLSGQVAVITNTVVGPLWGERVTHSLEKAGFKPIVLQIADGEPAKTLATVASLYDQLAAAGLERSEAVLALGGGVVGDIAGFVAATYLRGVPFVQAPTTVLSMVDSSVGGKVAVDHVRGKNLIGAFKQPVVVVADLATLLTLPAAERRSGLAEVIKHGLIAAPDILDRAEQDNALDLAWLIPRAVLVKVEIVQEDPFEQGRRAELNLGHTFGHALEKLSGYSLRHGEAVSIGMIAACCVAARMGICSSDLPARMEAVLRRVGLPVRHAGYAPEAIWEAMSRDKKRKAGRLRFVLPVQPGQMIVTDQVPQPLVLDILKEIGE